MKKLNRNNIFLGTGITLVFFLMAFSSIQSTIPAKEIIVQIEDNELQYFLSEDDLNELIFDLYDTTSFLPIEEINIGMLEDTLESLTYVRDAEVFSTLDGKLSIVVNQNRAIARVSDGNEHFYLNRCGQKMPLSRYHTAMVPFVTGNVNKENLEFTHKLLLQTESDPFYQNKITGLDFNKEEVTMFTSIGAHKVLLGTTDETKTKLTKLKMFYQSLETEEELKSLKTVNLMYKDQVVFTN